MLGGGPYEAATCPECGSTMWNGRCENPDCKYRWPRKKRKERTNDAQRKCSGTGNVPA